LLRVASSTWISRPTLSRTLRTAAVDATGMAG
jgi:hypothetical protein